MKKFILKIFIFSTIFSIFCFIAGHDYGKNEINNDYMYAIIDKHERLNSVEGRRIIFAGGSNLVFGIDSERIEKELKVPVVNLGLHGGLGLNFVLNELKCSIKKNDIVILSIEYLLSSHGDYRLKKYAARIFNDAKKYYRLDVIEELKGYLEDMRKNIKNNISSVLHMNKNGTEKKGKKQDCIYCRDAFNSYGDDTAHLDSKARNSLRDCYKLKYRFYEGIEALNKFYNYAKEKGVKVVFLFPPYPRSEYTKNVGVIKRYYSDLLWNLEIPIISTPEEFIFDDHLFFDTVWHLNSDGREKRTEKIINNLKGYLESNTQVCYSSGQNN